MIGGKDQSHLPAATFDPCFDIKAYHITRTLLQMLGCWSRGRGTWLCGKCVTQLLFPDFNFDPIRMNHNTLHYFSQEVPYNDGCAATYLVELLRGSGHDLLGRRRWVVGQAEVVHDV